MSLENKLSELRKLSQLPFKSDQEIERIEQLEEEIRLLYHDLELHNIVTEETYKKEPIVKRQKKSILDLIIQKIKPKPVTFDEIQQLKLEKQRAELKRDIAKAKYETKNPGGKSKNKKIVSVFGGSHKGPADGGLSKMVGSNDKNKYKDLIG